MVCPKCNSQLPDGAKFCGTCGNNTFAQPAQTVYVQQTVVSSKKEAPSKLTGIIALVLGVLSIVLLCTGSLSIVCGVVAVALAGYTIYVAKLENGTNGMAVGGLVCSAISLVLNGLVSIICSALFGSSINLIDVITVLIEEGF